MSMRIIVALFRPSILTPCTTQLSRLFGVVCVYIHGASPESRSRACFMSREVLATRRSGRCSAPRPTARVEENQDFCKSCDGSRIVVAITGVFGLRRFFAWRSGRAGQGSPTDTTERRR